MTALHITPTEASRDQGRHFDMARAPDKIRVGLIRCDLHGVYYAALMEEHDPLKLRSPRPPDYKGGVRQIRRIWILKSG